MNNRAMNPKGTTASQIKTIQASANESGGGAVFEITWPESLFIPYGAYPHKLGVQILDRAAAAAMIAPDGRLVDGAGRKIVKSKGFPIYEGNPDRPGSNTSDRLAYGWCRGMTAEKEGLRLYVKWSQRGRKLVDNLHYRFFVPSWCLLKTQRGLVPVWMKFLELTNDLNLPAENVSGNPAAKPKPAATAAAKRQQPVASNTAGQSDSDKRAALVAAAFKTTNPDLPLADRKRIAWRRAMAKNPKLFEQAPAGEAAQARPAPGRPATATTGTANAVKAAGKTGGQVVAAYNTAGLSARDRRAVLVAAAFKTTNRALPFADRKRVAWRMAKAKNPMLFSNHSTGADA